MIQLTTREKKKILITPSDIRMVIDESDRHGCYTKICFFSDLNYNYFVTETANEIMQKLGENSVPKGNEP